MFSPLRVSRNICCMKGIWLSCACMDEGKARLVQSMPSCTSNSADQSLQAMPYLIAHNFDMLIFCLWIVIPLPLPSCLSFTCLHILRPFNHCPRGNRCPLLLEHFIVFLLCPITSADDLGTETDQGNQISQVQGCRIRTKNR